MEQPPGRGDDLQPQDLSTSSIPTVIDLTRKSEECVLNATSLDAVRQVKSPGWYQNPRDPGRTFLDTDSINQSGEHIQPDNAFSHTTVTLSYVSRSRVFSTQDSVSRHSSLCSVPPISRLSLQPSQALNKGLLDSGYSLSQQYLQQVEEPGSLASPPDLLLSLSQAQDRAVGGEAVCLTQRPYVVNGGAGSRDNVSEENMDCSASCGDSSGLESSQIDGQSSPGACVESSPELLAPAAVEDEEQSGPEVVFLKSKTQDSKVMMDSVAAPDTCSINGDYTSPLEDPVSPSATSEDVFVLPQASCSPSGDNSYQETTGDSAVDGLSPEDALQFSDTSTNSTKEDSSGENKQESLGPRAVMKVSEDKPLTVLTHMNGGPNALHMTLNERKLPVRSSRGKRLEAIVMNINSGRYQLSGCIHNDKKAGDSSVAAPQMVDAQTLKKRRRRVRTSFSVKTIRRRARCPLKSPTSNNINTDSCSDATSDSKTLSIYKNCSTASKSPTSVVERTVVVPQPGQSTETTSTRSRRTRSSQCSPGFVVNQEKPTPLSSPEPCHEDTVETSPPLLLSSSKSPKNRGGKAKVRAVGGKNSPATKTKAPRSPQKRRRKKPTGRHSLVSMFSPKEPEIKLKYVNYKEEKKDQRSDGFSPFVHVERRESRPSLCTVVNYPEEVKTQSRKGQQQSCSSYFSSSVVPSSSCLQLGRVSTRGQHQRALVCCLCGQSANTMDLGDLHGPYYPEGYQPSTKRPANASGLKEDDSSDSDSSSCSPSGGIKRRKCAPPPTSWSFRAGAQLQSKGRPENQRWSDATDSPLAKPARSDSNGAAWDDWYSPPLLPQEPCEYWLHEDCGIWSAGVFLVKGKVYGLEEAVKAAQKMVRPRPQDRVDSKAVGFYRSQLKLICHIFQMCSACQDPGATLGCFFKGCSNKYHYRCALKSGTSHCQSAG